jgi:2-polyprenyl-3-methyl-5-hydroxy-6-metoxy-1,4-benzoquinol methylase
MSSPSSNAQIKFLLKSNKSFLYYRLCILITKFIKKHNYYNFLYFVLKPNKSDEEIFNQIAPYIKVYSVANADYLKYVAVNHMQILKQFIKTTPKYFLDLGCGKCDLTGHLGKELGLEPSYVFGTDIKDEFEPKWDALRKSNQMIIFDYMKNDKIPFDKKFDIITCFMVLHHIKTPENTIKNIAERLNKNGLLYIREHNCETVEDNIFADLVHSLYMLQNKASAEKIKSQNNFYKSAAKWRSIICSYGFEEIYYFQDAWSVSNNYKAVYKKL